MNPIRLDGNKAARRTIANPRLLSQLVDLHCILQGRSLTEAAGDKEAEVLHTVPRDYMECSWPLSTECSVIFNVE